jgi:hypothetical protein
MKRNQVIPFFLNNLASKPFRTFCVFVFALAACFLSCTKEAEPCADSSYLGTWKVEKNVICAIDSTNEVRIEKGPLPSQIQLALGGDTLLFTVINCKATHSSSDSGWMRNAEIRLEDDRIEFTYNRLVLLLWQNCSMTLVRK